MIYAIANVIRKNDPKAKIAYVKGDDLTNELVAAIQALLSRKGEERLCKGAEQFIHGIAVQVFSEVALLFVRFFCEEKHVGTLRTQKVRFGRFGNKGRLCAGIFEEAGHKISAA